MYVISSSDQVDGGGGHRKKKRILLTFLPNSKFRNFFGDIKQCGGGRKGSQRIYGVWRKEETCVKWCEVNSRDKRPFTPTAAVATRSIFVSAESEVFIFLWFGCLSFWNLEWENSVFVSKNWVKRVKVKTANSQTTVCLNIHIFKIQVIVNHACRVNAWSSQLRRW
jgi:hypothetical protein